MKILSLHDKEFEPMISGLDAVLQDTMQKMLDANVSGCTVNLKINVEIIGVDEINRIVPVVKFKITTNVPIRETHGGRVAEDLRLVAEGGQVGLVAGSEQTTMFDQR